MTKPEAEKIARVLGRAVVHAKVEEDEVGGKRVAVLLNQGPAGAPVRLLLEDIGWSIEQGKNLLAWMPIE